MKEGQLVAVVGPVGAGKSSLLSAFLGEMKKLKGTASLRVSSFVVTPYVRERGVGGRGGEGEREREMRVWRERGGEKEREGMKEKERKTV